MTEQGLTRTEIRSNDTISSRQQHHPATLTDSLPLRKKDLEVLDHFRIVCTSGYKKAEQNRGDEIRQTAKVFDLTDDHGAESVRDIGDDEQDSRTRFSESAWGDDSSAGSSTLQVYRGLCERFLCEIVEI